MKILHYSLGFPPYRTGGLTKYSFDLAKFQSEEGNEVAIMWPGHFFGKKTKIRNRGYNNGIRNFEIINPNPVSYDEGIKEVNKFINEGNYEVYEKFLKEFCPNIIHIHTLMGIHLNFLLAAKRNNIRIVFTAHDFFPICPKVTLYRDNGVCCYADGCDKCTSCNESALPLWKIVMLQSSFYRFAKDTFIVKKLRRKHRKIYQESTSKRHVYNDKEKPEEYLRLRGFYKEILSLIDLVHYNSNLTKCIYLKYLGDFNSVVIPISHNDVINRKTIKDFSDVDKLLRITYLGPYSGAKGYFLLRDALDILHKEKKQFILNVFFKSGDKAEYLREHDRYNCSQLKDIFEETDVLIVPSVWYETFGYTVIEALSYGVPIILTHNVGAKDVVPEGARVVINDISPKGVATSIKELTKEKLEMMNKCIINSEENVEMSTLVNRLYDELYLL